MQINENQQTHTNKFILDEQYLHFTSQHIISHKTGVVRTLWERKNVLVSTETYKNKEELYTTSAHHCGYPNWIFEKVSQVHFSSLV